MSKKSVPHLKVTICPTAIKEQAADLVRQLHPSWKGLEIKQKLFTDGLTNQLIGNYRNPDKSDMVLVRVYGEATEQFIDRAAEVRNMQIVADAGLGSNVLATFENGICYEFARGDVLNLEDLTDDAVWPLIAEGLAKIHAIVFEHSNVEEASVFSGLRNLITMVPEDCGTGLPTKAELVKEVEFIHNNLANRQYELVFCHNDLLCRNIIRQKNRAVFIDFEFAGPNPRSYDIANHFAEFSGVLPNYDSSRIPHKEYQLKWIKTYLLTVQENENNNGVDEEQLEANAKVLQKQVEQFSMLPHFYWSLWAIIQSKCSNLDFDFNTYAKCRLSDYFRLKNEVFNN